MPFHRLHPLLRHHIVNTLGWPALRPLQEKAIGSILDGDHVLILAPTAGGKTEAALLPTLSRLLEEEVHGFDVLYVCPLRALLNNLFGRIEGYCGMLGLRAGLWHGDVAQPQRRKLLDQPPHVLLTTPESLEAMLISSKGAARERLRRVRRFIVDEIHAFARDDRGTHLIAVVERVQALAGRTIQRIGLSATVGNPSELLHWLMNHAQGRGEVIEGESAGPVPTDVQLDYVGTLPNAATIVSRLHRGEKRLVFCDSRRRVEELGVALRAEGVETFLSHSSLSREQRHEAEAAFAEARDCVIVATSTLELGLDVGDLDRVIQIDAPSTVASFLQRLGRTGRRPGSRRNCLFLATSESAFLQAAGLLRLWESGFVESISAPAFPAHLLAQQLIALVLQHGRIPRNSCFQQLDRVAAFREIGPADREDILAYLLQARFFTEADGFLVIGDAAQAEFGRRNFLELVSAFSSPPVFTVVHGVAELGVVDQTMLRSLRDEGPKKPLRLAGRDWNVESVDWAGRVIHVSPASEGGRALWLAGGANLGFELCQAIKQTLISDDVPAWLTRRGGEALAAARRQYDFVREIESGCVPTDEGLEWHTFAGSNVNFAIEQFLAATFRAAASSTDFAVTLATGRGRGWSDVRRCLSVASSDDLRAAVIPPQKWIERLKFSACLPSSISAKTFASRLGLDEWATMKQTLGMSVEAARR